MYAANLSFARILLAIFRAISIGIKLFAPSDRTIFTLLIYSNSYFMRKNIQERLIHSSLKEWNKKFVSP